MDFRPLMPRDPALMDARIFRDEPMDLRGVLLTIPLDQRFVYDAAKNLFFVNLERFAVRSKAEIETIRRTVETRLEPIGRPSTPSSITTISRFCRSCSTNIRRWCAASTAASIRAFRATRPPASCG
jgi:hypothetical protein